MTPARFQQRRLGVVIFSSLAVISGCAAAGSSGTARKKQPSSRLGTKGTPWTILCIELSGPERVSRVGDLANSLRNTPGIRAADVSVGDEPDGYARLYYGTYFRKTEKKTGKRSIPKALAQDMELIKQLGDASGRRYFLGAMVVRLPTPDVGNPAWDLAKANARYSLQVAVFEPTEDFWEYKQAAADYCEWLRKKGYEAYYHHSIASSVVTVGLFGPEAVIVRPNGLADYSEAVRTLQRDELMQHNLLNGGVYYVRDEKGNRTAMPSRLVELPKRAAASVP